MYTGNSAEYSVMTHMGKESKKEWTYVYVGFPGNSVGKETTCSAPGLIPRSRRSPGRGNGNPLQFSCPENPTNRGAWRVTVHRVTRIGRGLMTKSPPCKYVSLIYFALYLTLTEHC